MLAIYNKIKLALVIMEKSTYFYKSTFFIGLKLLA
jgi:hypothetical protein